MVEQQIIQYIMSALDQGYDLQTIRNTLIRNGWPQTVVDEAIRSLYQNMPGQPMQMQSPQPEVQHVKHTIHLSGTVAGIIISILVVAIIGVFAVIFFGNSNTPSGVDPNAPIELLDYKITISDKDVAVGEYLRFINKFSNMGTSQRYDITIDYKIRNKQSGTLVDSWKETKAVTAVQEYAVERIITSDISEGVYLLEAEVTYSQGTQRAHASEVFEVTPDPNAPSCSDGIKNQEESSIDCGGPCDPCDLCSDGKRNQGEEGIDCGGPCSPCPETCTNCDDKNACTVDRCIDGECFYKKLNNCCGNDICEASESIETCTIDCGEPMSSGNKNTAAKQEPKKQYISPEQIKKEAERIAKDDLNSAGKFCSDLGDSTKSDYCFRTVAHAAGNKRFCEYIESGSVADFCYMKFATAGDTTVCEKITNLNLKKACKAFGTQ